MEETGVHSLGTWESPALSPWPRRTEISVQSRELFYWNLSKAGIAQSPHRLAWCCLWACW